MKWTRLAACGIALAPLASGCAMMDSRAISFPDRGNARNYQRLFMWRSHYSAGMGTNGGICAQAATTAQARSSDTRVTAGGGLLVPFSPAQLGAMSEAQLAAVSRTSNTNVMLTNATNGQTAFANIAFFYLCQLSLNNSLTDEQVASLWRSTLETVERVSITSIETSSLLATTPPPGGAPNPPADPRAPADGAAGARDGGGAARPPAGVVPTP